MTIHHSIASFFKRWSAPTTQIGTAQPRALLPTQQQPNYVRRCAVTQSLIPLLRLVAWDVLPKTTGGKRTGWRTIPLPAYIGAYLVKLEQRLPTFGSLHRFLRQHPGLIWALGMPLVADSSQSSGLDVEASLPTQRHLSRKLSSLPNDLLQNLLDEQVDWLKNQLGDAFGAVISLDTKHIISWVKENNPKAFIEDGCFDKTKQPSGDPDCKLGCKRRRNQKTPTKEGQSATGKTGIGEFYWGYASGVVVTKVADVGEFVIAEMTQTFDKADITYFFPLIAMVEMRLGRRPSYFTADAAYDAFYIYDYFHREDEEGFAAIPLRQMNQTRRFDEQGRPLCEADLAMFLKGSFTNRTSLVKHRRGRFACPLLLPEVTADACPVDHPKWRNGGCSLVMPTDPGARIRYQLDRESDAYKAIFNQRTAVERIFSQAMALGIERPKLRNQQAIANQNTLTYILINLRAMQRLAAR